MKRINNNLNSNIPKTKNPMNQIKKVLDTEALWVLKYIYFIKLIVYFYRIKVIKMVSKKIKKNKKNIIIIMNKRLSGSKNGKKIKMI